MRAEIKRTRWPTIIVCQQAPTPKVEFHFEAAQHSALIFAKNHRFYCPETTEALTIPFWVFSLFYYYE